MSKTIRKRPPPSRRPRKGTLAPVTPIEIDRVRRSVLDVVKSNIPVARDVLQGRTTWSTQQVNLFKSMLNKVMPDLHHSFAEHHHEHRKVDELSRDELMEIINSPEPEVKRPVGRPRKPENEPIPVMDMDKDLHDIDPDIPDEGYR